jgi:hypothetical protein
VPSSAYRLVVCTLFLAASAPVAGAAESGFKVSPLAGTVSLLRGNDCNIAVSAGEDGVVVVDTCSMRTSDQLIASI